MKIVRPLSLPLPSPPDPRIEAAARGDRTAAAALLREVAPRVRNLVRYLVRGDGDIDDIAQEALVSILGGLASFRGEGTFVSWCDRIVARQTFASLRRRRRDRLELLEPEPLAELPSPDAAPDDYAARRQLVTALDHLPNDQRHALVLHHVMGLSVPEIAADLEVPVETVRSRLRLGRAAFRKLHDLEDGR